MYSPGVLLRSLFLLLTATATAADDLESLVDPTRPLTVGGTTETSGDMVSADLFEGLRSYEVSSILIRPDRQLAVVNAERVTVGDEVGGATVLAIEPGRVLLDLNGETREVPLHQRSIKTPAGSAGDDVPQ